MDVTAPGPIDPLALLEHADWARALAAHLVRDDASADDLVQETWFAAIRRLPSGDRPLRPWLATVMRRLALRRRRDDGRRERRDRAAGTVVACGSAPSAASVAAALDAHRALGAAVESLPEPYRTTVYLRYYEGLDGNAVAARTGVPPATARWRLARGLELLRAHLDARSPGGRGAWRALLAPLVPGGAGGPPKTPDARPPAQGPASGNVAVPASQLAAAGAILMTSTTKVMVAVAVIAALAGGAWFGTEALRGPAVPTSASPEDGTGPAPAGRPGDRTPPRRARAGTRDAADASASPQDAATADRPDRGAAATTDGPLVRVRVEDPEGAPVAGASVSIRDGETNVVARSDAAGAASLRLVQASAPRTLELAIDADGLTSAWRYVDVPATGEVDAGVVRLADAGTVEGFVVGPDGLAVAGAEVGVVDRDVPDGALAGARRSPHGIAESAPRTRTDAAGRFVLAGVPVGASRLWVHARGWLGSASERVNVRARQRTQGVRIGMERPDPSEVVAGVVVDADARPVAGARVHYSYWYGSVSGTTTIDADDTGRFVILIEKDGVIGSISAAEPSGSRRSAVIASVRPGGSPLTLTIGAGPSVVLRVRAPGGAAIGRFGWTLVAESGATLFHEAVADRADGDATLDLPATRTRILVDAPGHDLARSDVIDPDAPPAHVVVVATPLPGLRGTVVAGETVIAGATVALLRAVGEDEVVEINRAPTRCESEPEATTVTGEDGAFDVTVRVAGRWFVRAEARGFASALEGPFDVDPRAGRTGVRIALRRPGAIEGRVVVDAGRSAADVIVALTCFDGRPRTVRTAADGSFRADGLTPGGWLVTETQHEIRAGETLTTRVRGRPDLTTNCDVPEGGVATMTLDLRDAARTFARFDVRVDGHAAEGWMANVLRDASLFSTTATQAPLDADGRARIAVRAAVRTGVRLQPPSGPSVFVPADLATSLDVTVRIATGRVDITGLPASPRATHMLVSIAPGGVAGLAQVRGDSEGRCTVTGLVAGRVRLVAGSDLSATTPPAEWPAAAEGDLAAGETLTLGLTR